MFKLLLKYMIGFIILGLISIAILYIISQKMFERGLEETMKTMNRGVFYSLQEQFKQYPPSQWPSILQELQPPSGNEAAIISITSLHVPNDKMQQLRAGKFIVIKDKDRFYFGYSVSEPLAYQRIGNSEYVLMMREIPLAWIAHRVSAWMTHLITLELQHTSRKAWPDKIQQLQKIYDIPLAITDISDTSLPNSVTESLSSTDFVLSNPNADGKIEYAYALIEDNSILKIGPIPYLLYPQYQPYILASIFVLIAIAFIILMTYIFSRNLEKIYKITEKYSHGDFINPPVISKYSTLQVLYHNILRMGDKIQNLMNTQRNLTRFIAHECRTPLSTILFAIDKLEKEKLSPDGKASITSIKSDISDLNELVSTFLNYARFSDQDLPLHYQSVNINLWIKACIEKYQHAPKNIILTANIAQNAHIEFDPNLMKHVIYNLLDNGLKYADSQIQIMLELKDNTFIIYIDNDGGKISEEDNKNIFSPFTRLESDENTARKGFGLGLAIAQMIVKRHHGSLSLSDSRLGGVCFTIHLPLQL